MMLRRYRGTAGGGAGHEAFPRATRRQAKPARISYTFAPAQKPASRDQFPKISVTQECDSQAIVLLPDSGNLADYGRPK
jgi:hypothetical protein